MIYLSLVALRYLVSQKIYSCCLTLGSNLLPVAVNVPRLRHAASKLRPGPVYIFVLLSFTSYYLFLRIIHIVIPYNSLPLALSVRLI